MWTDKPVADWTEEEKNHFLTLLMGKEWHDAHKERIYPGQPMQFIYPISYLNNEGFFTVKSFMEQSLLVVWEGYVDEEFILFRYDKKEAFTCLNNVLDLSNLITFLLDNQKGWAWKECPKCFNGICTKHKSDPSANDKCDYCKGYGKVKHPALLYSESLKGE